MKISLAEVQTMLRSLQSFLEIDLPIKLAYKFSKLGDQIFKEAKTAEEMRSKLVKKHGKKNEKNKRFEVLPDKMEEFGEEWSKFIDETNVEIEFDPVSIDEIEGINNIKGLYLLHLGKFFKDSKQSKKK